MIIPTTLVRLIIGEKPQRSPDPLANLVWICPAPRLANAQSRERETGGGHTGDVGAPSGRLASIRPDAVQNKAGMGIALLPEKEERAARKVIEKSVIGT